jgi:transcriptional regulator with XRE-family HTH domain
MNKFNELKLHIGKRLKALRLNAGLTLEDLASEANIGFVNYFYLEKGTRNHPRLETLYKLAEFYHVPVAYFFHNNRSLPDKANAEQQKLFREFNKLSRAHKTLCLQMLAFLNKKLKK